MLASYLAIAWTVVGQASKAARDQGLIEVVALCEGETSGQLAWLKTRMKEAAPQALIVSS